MEKNQAAIDTGRYEIENRRFVHPNDYRQQQQQQNQHYTTTAAPLHGITYDDAMGSSWDVSGGTDRGRQSSRSKLGNFFNKASGRPSSQGVTETPGDSSLVPERAKLRKRSSSLQSGSKLSVVGE